MGIRDKKASLNSKKERILAWWRRHWYVKYLVVIGFFFLVTFVFGDANINKQIRYKSRINNLKKELREVKERYHQDSVRLEEIRANKQGIEHTARELYLMKRPEEIIFLIKDSIQDKQ